MKPARMESIEAARQVQLAPDIENEAVEIEALASLLRDCKRFIDVGANIGQYTWFASQSLPGGEIVAIEADPRLVEELRVCAAGWASSSGTSITVIHAAIADQRGEIPFYRDADVTTGSIWNRPTAQDVLTVPARRLDDLVDPGEATLVKIDIEGAEYRALLGARRLLDASNVSFLVELHGWGDPELKKYPVDVAMFMMRSGYSVRKVGTHYIFLRCRHWPHVSYLRVAPLLLAKYIYRRWFSFMAPFVLYLSRRGLLTRV
jgi:FkbM family methyltransferase